MSGGGAVALGGSVSIANAGVTSVAAGTGISVSASTGGVTITNTAPAVAAGLAKAWVNYNAVTKVINNSFNVSSVTYNATGNYNLNFTTAMPNAYYAVAGMAWDNNNNARLVAYGALPTTTSCQIICVLPNNYTSFDSNNTTVVIQGS